MTASHKRYRIASVDSCAKEHAQVCGVNSAVGADPGTFVATSWKQIGQSWLAENPLLNSDDVACVAVISEHEDLTSMAAGIRPSWTARVADVTLKIYHSRKDYSATKTSELAQFFYTSILLQGTDVYWFLLLFTFMLTITLRMAGLSKLADLSSNKGITIVVVSIILAASSSEILVYIFASDSSALVVERRVPAP